ncbi:MAG: aminotransferase class I/II-fold pyridoxal phosphate-dependent enzyme, partial [Phenylobacterium sp.]|nr:aminotransferase class I/II-fold pyridoxal phosphate-dependent enzyme [Phenylobacterium sp.]
AGAGSVYPTAHIDLSMGTFSKALGGYGAYVCASAPVIDLIKTRARTFVYTTGLPPANAAAALAALDVIAADPDLVARPLANARRFTRALNLPEATSAVVPIMIGESDRALTVAQALESAGFLAVAIRPPTVPAGTARLRLAFTAGHTARDIDGLMSAIVGLVP